MASNHNRKIFLNPKERRMLWSILEDCKKQAYQEYFVMIVDIQNRLGSWKMYKKEDK